MAKVSFLVEMKEFDWWYEDERKWMD